MNLNRLLLPSRPAQGDAPFRPVHTPDRPEAPTPVTAAPSDEECMRFLEAFRSPKSYGFSWDDDEDEDDEPAAWPLSEPLEAKEETEGKLSTMDVSIPVIGQASVAVAVAVERSAGPKVVSAVGKPWAEEDRKARRAQRAVGITALHEVQTRSKMLASHRMAARCTWRSSDSGYGASRRSDASLVAGREKGQWPSTEDSAEEDSGARAVLGDASRRTTRILSARNANDDGATAVDGSRYSRPGSHVVHELKPPDTLKRAIRGGLLGKRPVSKFQNWPIMEKRWTAAGRGVDLYADWAEHYFETDNFEGPSSERTSLGATVETTGDETDEKMETVEKRETIWEDFVPESPSGDEFVLDGQKSTVALSSRGSVHLGSFFSDDSDSD
ncbi:hypothetical protein HYQ45_006208 [Verticillium longisporum]|nr:hypothetical protein HYQ44_007270 [Verticillium longisporum]KAG7136249.1 hypothetical protein HYQ45_006208 [Verticillium longisporum]